MANYLFIMSCELFLEEVDVFRNNLFRLLNIWGYIGMDVGSKVWQKMEKTIPATNVPIGIGYFIFIYSWISKLWNSQVWIEKWVNM